MAAVTRTPPLPTTEAMAAAAAAAAQSPRPPSRVTRDQVPPIRGATPKFLLPTVPRMYNSPMQTTTGNILAPSTRQNGSNSLATRAARATDRSINNNNNNTSNTRDNDLVGAAAKHGDRKRTHASAVIDLTATTTTTNGSSSEEPLSKKQRTVTAPAPVPPAPIGGGLTETDAKRKQQRADKHGRLAAESAAWRLKYKKAFPTFTFYFDALDNATEAALSKAVQRLGASVDNFFSKKVTHVVTSRALPQNGEKENEWSPPSKSKDSAAGPQRTARQPLRSPNTFVRPSSSKTRQPADGLEKNVFIDTQDILLKAADFGLKTWHVDKLQLILTRINSFSPLKADNASHRNQSLPSLLRDEQLYGTRERDPFVPRADTHYFDPKSCFILVEDSTGEHRPIAAREYTRPRRSEDPEWPVLWGGIEGRGAFYHHRGKIRYESRLPPPAPRAEQQANVAGVSRAPIGPNGHALAAARAVAPAAPDLRRSLSLQAVNRARQADSSAATGKQSYIAASGNSQIITSTNLTSARSGAVRAVAGGSGALVDKRVAQLSNRTVSSMAGSKLKGSEVLAPGKLKRSVSVDAGLNARAPPPREEPKKPGYCENCRLKYDDFKDHVVSGKHRRFALNENNWVELDALLRSIKRRPAEVLPSDPQQSDEYEELSYSEDGSSDQRDDSGFHEVDSADECDE